MLDFCTATDIRNNAWSTVEKFFNDHPEYTQLLKNLDEGITRSACKMIRSPKGFDCTCEYKDGWINSRLVEVTVNLGGIEDGTS